MQCGWQLCGGERNRAARWELLHRGGRWSKIERGDIVNKGDIVCNADDSRAAEEPLSVCDTSSIIASPVLSFSDLLHSPFTHFLSLNGWVRLPGFFLLRSWWIAWLSLPGLFSLSSSPRLAAFLPPFFLYFLQRTRNPNTLLSSHFSVSKHQSIYTREKCTHFPRLP